MTQIKNLSLWAKNHKWATRILIIIAFLFLDIIGIITGVLMNDLSIIINPAIFYFFVILFIATIGFYPRKSNKKTSITQHVFYVRQKSCDLVLAGSTFLMIVCIGNNDSILETNFISAAASTRSIPVSTADSTLKPYKSIAAFSASMKNENGKLLKWNERRKLLKEQIRGIKKANDISKGGKAALMILCSLIAAGLLLLIVAWSCDLSCSGSDGAALLVGVGGTAAVIFLLLLAVRLIYGRIKKGKKIKKEEMPATENKQ